MAEILEPMAEFFAKRADGYDEHMLANVEGCREAYPFMASLVPKETKELLDLGCGTGLELDEIFKLLPDILVTGVDMTAEMLALLRKKHPEKNLKLICGDYFAVDFGKEAFDCAVSFETMHHFSHDKKTALYCRIRDALKDGGCYIECDYMVEMQQEEDHWYAEYNRLLREEAVPEGVFVHYDTPCTIENQLAMLKDAGFSSVEHLFRKGNTSIIVAKR